jgi:hypothetical protein
MSLRSRCYPGRVLLDVSTAQRHRNGRALHLSDQPSKRHRYDCAQYRKANPESKGLAPHRITDAQEPWAEALNHNGRIGNFFFKLYRATELSLRTLRAVEDDLAVGVELGAPPLVVVRLDLSSRRTAPGAVDDARCAGENDF